MSEPQVYSMGYDELNTHVGHRIEINDVWDWGTNRQTGIEVRCLDCEGEGPLFEVELTPNGGGKKVTREEALDMLRFESIPAGLNLMSYEYGQGSCGEVDEETGETDERYWTGLEYEDYETIRDDDEYQNFELWSNDEK